MATNRKSKTKRPVADIASILATPAAYVDEISCALIQGRSRKSIQRDRCLGIGARYHKIHGRLVRYRVADIVEFMESAPAFGGGRHRGKVA